MDTSMASAAQALTSALDQQMLGASVITGTLNKMNGGGPVAAMPDMSAQKAVLAAAYADKGVGTRIDMMV